MALLTALFTGPPHALAARHVLSILALVEVTVAPRSRISE
jgi:hypothetical protein